MKHIIFIAVCLVFLIGGCRAPKDVVYFQGIENLSEEQLAKMNQKYTPRICIDDALIINVTSPDRATVAQFSPPPFGYYLPGESEIGIMATTHNLFTYLVDENGTINFPVIGRIHLAGLSVNEAIRKMEELIWETAPAAVISVQIANFKVSIMGEVLLPDSYDIKTPRLSILDLIAKSGGMTIMANRKNVLLLRDNNGEKVPVIIDLTDPGIIASPYYYLQQNDIVIIQPNEAQQRTALFSNKDNTRLTLFSVIIASISFIMSTISNFR